MDNIKQLLDLNVEIEGLLRVADCRKSETAEALLLSKAKQFIEILSSSIKEEDSSACPLSDISVQVTGLADKPTDTKMPEEKSMTNPSDTVVKESTENLSEEMETVLEMDEETTDAAPTPATTTPPAFETTDRHIPTETTTPATGNSETGAITKIFSNGDDHVMRVDEMIQMQSSRDLKKAFSLNDRFKYIREIFDNDADYFDETLKNLDMLTNLDEVYDYLLGDIGLNHEDETVKEFLSIIYNHFKV